MNNKVRLLIHYKDGDDIIVTTPTYAIEALLNYEQADEEGIIVSASRQAIHECVEYINILQDEVSRLQASERSAWNAAVQRDEDKDQLVESLSWAMPLANLAMENHRIMRLKAGHSDIGTKKIGLYDDEVETMEKHFNVLKKFQKT